MLPSWFVLVIKGGSVKLLVFYIIIYIALSHLIDPRAETNVINLCKSERRAWRENSLPSDLDWPCKASGPP